MTVSTQEETYRPYRGSLRTRRLRFLPLAAAGIRTAARRKLPLVLLFLAPAGFMAVFSFLVYQKFAVLEGVGQDVGGLRLGRMLPRAVAAMIEVRELIAAYNAASRFFLVLIVAWYGAGLLAEDRRGNAHLLYFTRPLTRLDYLLSKLAVVGFFGGLAAVVPGLFIGMTAVLASPGWSFLDEQGWVIPATLAYGTGWVLVMSVTVLAVSALTRRKVFALAGFFGVLFLPWAAGRVLRRWTGEWDYVMLGPTTSFREIAEWLFEVRWGRRVADAETPLLVVGVLFLLGLAVLVLRLRRLEAVS